MKMRNEKGGLGGNAHRRSLLPISPLFAFIIVLIKRCSRQVDFIVNQIGFRAFS